MNGTEVEAPVHPARILVVDHENPRRADGRFDLRSVHVSATARAGSRTVTVVPAPGCELT